MESFHGDEAVKEKYLKRVMCHAKADVIIKGQYWENGKGCAVGCTIHSSDHNAYESELGLPEWLARVEDTIFEGLPNDEAKNFPQQFLEAIPVGKDLEMVRWKFTAFLLERNLELQLSLKIDEKFKERLLASTREVLGLYKKQIETGAPESPEAWATAETAWATAETAWATAWAEAWATAETAWATAETAWATARATAETARATARATAETARATAETARATAETAWATAETPRATARATAETAWATAFKTYRDELLKLLRAA